MRSMTHALLISRPSTRATFSCADGAICSIGRRGRRFESCRRDQMIGSAAATRLDEVHATQKDLRRRRSPPVQPALDTLGGHVEIGGQLVFAAENEACLVKGPDVDVRVF